jgi:signal peptidase I
MAPSLLQGDLVLLLPAGWVDVQEGDVVAMVDPLDPAVWTLRRVEALEGTVHCENGMLYGDAPRDLVELGRENGVVVAREGEHLVEHLSTAIHWEMEELIIPEGSVFLSADRREAALDSRWWGPMPAETMQAVVVGRVGKPEHRWRGWLGGR